MAQPIVLADPSNLGQGIQTAGSALAQALQQRNLQKQQQQQRTILSEAIDKGINELGQNPTPMQYVNFLSNMAKAGVPTEYLKIYQQAFLPQIKAQAQNEIGNQFLQRLGLASPQQPMQQQQPPMQQPIQQMSEQIDITTMSQEEPEIEGAPARKGEVPSVDSALANLNDSQLAEMKASGIERVAELADFEIERRKSARKDFRQDREFA